MRAAANSVKRAVRCGVDVIYHCESADEEAIDMLESVKDRIFVGPAIGIIYGTLYEGEPFGFHRDSELGRNDAAGDRDRLPRCIRSCAAAVYGFSSVGIMGLRNRRRGIMRGI